MCVKERGHTSLSGFRERLRTVGEGTVSSRQAQVSLGLLLTAHGRLSPGPRPPGPLQTWLCMRLLQARQVRAQRGPRLGIEGKPGSSSPLTAMGPWPPLQHYRLPLPLTSAWLHTGRALGGRQGQGPWPHSGWRRPASACPVPGTGPPILPKTTVTGPTKAPTPLHTPTHLTACSRGGRGPERLEPAHN